MNTLYLQPIRSVFVATLGLLVSLATVSSAQAQTMLGVDPYRPYIGGYESFAVPPSPLNTYSAINTMRSRSASSGANQMSQFYEDLYGSTDIPGVDATRKRSGLGVKYTDAYRDLDKQLGRVYQPNNGQFVSDAAFYRDQQERTKEYFDAMKDPDPKKRAERLRALELRTLKAARASSSPNVRGAPNALSQPRATNPPGAVGAGAARGRVPQSGVERSTRTNSPGRTGTTLPLTPLGERPSAIRGGSTSSSPPLTSRMLTTPLGTPLTNPPSASNTRATTPAREKPSDILRRALQSQPATAEEGDDLVPPLFPRDRNRVAPPR
jgi:hypothetical protein